MQEDKHCSCAPVCAHGLSFDAVGATASPTRTARVRRGGGSRSASIRPWRHSSHVIEVLLLLLLVVRLLLLLLEERVLLLLLLLLLGQRLQRRLLLLRLVQVRLLCIRQRWLLLLVILLLLLRRERCVTHGTTATGPRVRRLSHRSVPLLPVFG